MDIFKIFRKKVTKEVKEINNRRCMKTTKGFVIYKPVGPHGEPCPANGFDKGDDIVFEFVDNSYIKVFGGGNSPATIDIRGFLNGQSKKFIQDFNKHKDTYNADNN